MPNAINVVGGANNLSVSPAVRNVQLILDQGRSGPPGLSNATHLFIYKDNAGQPSTPTGGSWNGSVLTPPAGWLVSPPSSIVNNLWSCDVYVAGAVANITAWGQAGTYSGVGSGGSIQVGAFPNINNVQFTGATVTNPGGNLANVDITHIYSGSGSPSITPVNKPAFYFDTVTTSIYEWASGAVAWTKAVDTNLTLQVDGVDVVPVTGKINFADSTDQFNRVQFSVLGNTVKANLDPTSPAIVAELSIGNLLGTQAISIDYPDGATGSYSIVMPGNQGGSGQTLINDGLGNLSWQTPSGGGGGALVAVSKWTSANSTSKAAYTAPAVINNDGITINLTASTGSGAVTSCKVTLNGGTLIGTYTATGTFPNYVLVVPTGDLVGNGIEVAPSVMVGITGSFSGSMFNVSSNNLTNIAPVPFTTTLSGTYALSNVPYYTTTGTLNYSYSNSVEITSFGGVLTPGGNATSPSGSFSNVALTGSTISGSATGNGLYGAGSATVTLTGSVPAVPTFIPAFYAQSASLVIPSFTTGSLQTSGSQIGSVITYNIASASTNYVWLATTRPITSVRQITTFGQATVTADSTSTQVISGTTFNVFGFTNLSTTTAVQLTVIN